MKTNILWDCHVHSSFSADSLTPLKDMIQQAESLGMEGICITEHLDPDYPETPDHTVFTLDLPSYKETLLELRELYQNKLDVRFGIELGMQPHLSSYFNQLVSEEGFDFVIASSHVVKNFDPYYPEYFEQYEEATAYRYYFESILENLANLDFANVYGHLDYIVRYGPNKNRFYTYEAYQDIMDEILQTLIKKQVGIELNTGGFHYGLGEPNPSISVLKRYRELGGEIITIGSDAHKSEDLTRYFDKAEDILKDCGFRYYTVFKERKPQFIKL